MSKLAKLLLRILGYKTATIAVGKSIGYGENMTVVYKCKKPTQETK